MKHKLVLFILLPVLSLACNDTPQPQTPTAHARLRAQASLKLHPSKTGQPDWLEATLPVHENRTTKRGRKIYLHIVILPAQSRTPLPDPVFVLHGGPGGAATTLAHGLHRSWMRQQRDIVLVDQRGTGQSNPLKIKLSGSPANLQGYLDPIFQVEVFRQAKKKLERQADLRFYTTPLAMDDLNDVRQTLGYSKINLVGASYGTRTALIYMRRHEKHVRTATLMGVAPVAFRNPLYHAKAAQEGLDRIFQEVAATPAAKAFPNLKKKFTDILTRLEKEPARLQIFTDRQRTKSQTVTLNREAFCEALRVMMYAMSTNRKVPLLLHRAWQGNYKPFALSAIQANRNIRNIVALGMLMCVTGSEDIPRIREEDIVRETKDTFLGDSRVRRQIAVSKLWPRGEVPADYGQPVRVKTPTLLVSGTHDPVTPPRWGTEAARHLPHSVHLIVPAAHGSFGSEVEKIRRQFLRRGSVRRLDVSGVKKMRLPGFAME